MTYDHLVLAASLTCLIAPVSYGGYLFRFVERWARVGLGFLAVGLAVSLLAAGVRMTAGGPYGLTAALLGSAIVMVCAFVVAQVLRPQLTIVGSFVAPVVTMMLYSIHVFAREGSAHSTELAVVTPVHIGASLLGFLVFTVSAVAAALSLVQEQRLKQKRIAVGRGLGKLPSLKQLEVIGHRALVVGFPIYSVGVALGAVWLAKSGTVIHRHIVMAGLSWALYAGTLYARLAIGWRGRRAAMITLGAYASTLFVVLLSILRVGGAG